MSDHFLPNFCTIRWVLGCLLFALFLALILGLNSRHSGYGFWSEFGLRSLFILWIALISEAVLCVLRRHLTRLNDLLAGIGAFIVIQSVTLLVSGLTYGVLPDPGPSLSSAGAMQPTGFYLRNLAISSVIALVLLRYLYVQHQWHTQVKAESEARLAVLQSRIRPHFLFNSLNTIAQLIRSQPEMAEELVQDLAELFRASLKTDAKLVSLANEVALVKQYLHFEWYRLGRRLAVQWDLGKVPDNALLPPLSLQPLVENAVYHGIEPAAEGGLVEISGHKRNENIVLIIRNSLPKQPAARFRPGNRMAVDNVRARIQGYFPLIGKIYVSSTEHYYQVQMIIPYQTAAR